MRLAGQPGPLGQGRTFLHGGSGRAPRCLGGLDSALHASSRCLERLRHRTPPGEGQGGWYWALFGIRGHTSPNPSLREEAGPWLVPVVFLVIRLPARLAPSLAAIPSSSRPGAHRAALWEAGLSHFLSSPRMGLSWQPRGPIGTDCFSLSLWKFLRPRAGRGEEGGSRRGPRCWSHPAVQGGGPGGSCSGQEAAGPSQGPWVTRSCSQEVV